MESDLQFQGEVDANPVTSSKYLQNQRMMEQVDNCEKGPNSLVEWVGVYDEGDFFMDFPLKYFVGANAMSGSW